MINQGISNLYKIAETGDSAQEPVIIRLDKENYLKNVTFGPPSVIVLPDFSNVTSVRFRMTLQTGRASLYRFIDKDETEERMNLTIKVWSVTLPVNVGKSLCLSPFKN